MKKYVVAGFVALVFLPSLSSAQAVADIDTSGTASCAIISVNLRYLSRDSSTGGAVSVLQDFLNSKGYLSSQPTGFFGSMTRTAVIAFQTANGISATPAGFVGQATRAKIQAIDCGTTAGMTVTPVSGSVSGTTSPLPSSTSDLQAYLSKLIAQVAALQAQVSTNSTVSPATITANTAVASTAATNTTAPIITRIDPATITRGVTKTFTVYGSNLDGTTYAIGNTPYGIPSSGWYTKDFATILVPSVTEKDSQDSFGVGRHTIFFVKTSSDGDSFVRSNSLPFAVVANPDDTTSSNVPVLSSLGGNASVLVGDTIHIYGTNLKDGTVIIDSKDLDIPATYTDSNSTLNFTVPSTLTQGVHTVYVQQSITGKASNTLPFTVSSATPLTPTVTASFSPSSLSIGGSTATLTYYSTNAKYCNITNPDLDRVFSIPNSYNQPVSGTESSGMFSSTQTYTRIVTCYNSAGQSTTAKPMLTVTAPTSTSIPTAKITSAASQTLNSVTISGTWANNPQRLMTIWVGNLASGAVTVNTDGTWSFSPANIGYPLTSGSYTVKIFVNGVALDTQQLTVTSLVKTIPTVSLVALPSAMLTSGTVTLAKFKISPIDANSAGWKKVSFTLSKTSSLSLEDVSKMQLVDETGSVVSGSFALASGNLGNTGIGGTVSFTASSEQPVANVKTYSLKEIISGTIPTGAHVSIAVVNPFTGVTMDNQTLTGLN